MNQIWRDCHPECYYTVPNFDRHDERCVHSPERWHPMATPREYNIARIVLTICVVAVVLGALIGS